MNITKIMNLRIVFLLISTRQRYWKSTVSQAYIWQRGMDYGETSRKDCRKGANVTMQRLNRKSSVDVQSKYFCIVAQKWSFLIPSSSWLIPSLSTMSSALLRFFLRSLWLTMNNHNSERHVTCSKTFSHIVSVRTVPENCTSIFFGWGSTRMVYVMSAKHQKL